jgi:hypothetical protein
MSSFWRGVERLTRALDHGGAVPWAPRPPHDLVCDALVVERLLHSPAGAELRSVPAAVQVHGQANLHRSPKTDPTPRTALVGSD